MGIAYRKNYCAGRVACFRHGAVILWYFDLVVLGYQGGMALQYQSGKLYGRMVS